MPRYSFGCEFGTEAVRGVAVEIRSGQAAGWAVESYRHGVIDPRDWLDAAWMVCRSMMGQSGISADNVIGIGVAFTSCTVLPCLGSGAPLFLLDQFSNIPQAWPKLPQHRAVAEAERINQIARERSEPWLARSGGTIGPEWFFPKVLGTLNDAPEVYDAADVWIEGGDWLVWQLIGGPFPHCSASSIVRSRCQAGFRAMWNARTGYPSRDYFRAVHPALADVVQTKMPGMFASPGAAAGRLTARAAHLLGLRPGIPVSASIMDTHARVAGSGVASPSTMVMTLGDSACHLMNSRIEATVPGAIGAVQDGILPGYFGYETYEPLVGNALEKLAQILNLSHEELNRLVAQIPPGSGGVVATDLGELLDGNLSDAFAGLTATTRPEQMYRALMEGIALDLRSICENFREAGVPVRRFVAGGGLPAKFPLLMQIYADVLDARIKVTASEQPVAHGAAILGCIAAGTQVSGYSSISQAIHAMAPRHYAAVYRPDLQARKAYDKLYVERSSPGLR